MWHFARELVFPAHLLWHYRAADYGIRFATRFAMWYPVGIGTFKANNVCHTFCNVVPSGHWHIQSKQCLPHVLQCGTQWALAHSKQTMFATRFAMWYPVGIGTFKANNVCHTFCNVVPSGHWHIQSKQCLPHVLQCGTQWALAHSKQTMFATRNPL